MKDEMDDTLAEWLWVVDNQVEQRDGWTKPARLFVVTAKQGPGYTVVFDLVPMAGWPESLEGTQSVHDALVELHAAVARVPASTKTTLWPSPALCGIILATRAWIASLREPAHPMRLTYCASVTTGRVSELVFPLDRVPDVTAPATGPIPALLAGLIKEMSS